MLLSKKACYVLLNVFWLESFYRDCNRAVTATLRKERFKARCFDFPDHVGAHCKWIIKTQESAVHSRMANAICRTAFRQEETLQVFLFALLMYQHSAKF